MDKLPHADSTVISLVTCAREGASYVEATAAALLAAGADTAAATRIVIVDGPAWPPPLPGWDMEPGGEKLLGLCSSMWRAFRAALDAGAERLIFCEDDIIPCRNAVRAMATIKIPSWAAFVDFHDLELRTATNGGLLRLPANGCTGAGYLGTQCMVFPRRTLLWLIRHNPHAINTFLPNGDRLTPEIVRNHADTALGLLLAKSMWPSYAAHLPRLVRHVGVVSAAFPGQALHATPNYPGDDFDALGSADR